MNQLSIKGSQSFMGKEIPVILGGFGANKKCICDKTIAEIHGMKTRHVRENISNNMKRFRENVDYIDVKGGVGDTDTSQMGYTFQEVLQAEHIYILSERGYAKLIKIMDTDLAWEIHDKLIDEYFELREEKRRVVKSAEELAAISKRAQATLINATQRTADLLTSIWDKAGIKPEYQVLALNDVCANIGIRLPRNALQGVKQTYDKTTIAKMVGVYSKASGGKEPHAQAVGAIINQLDINLRLRRYFVNPGR